MRTELASAAILAIAALAGAEAGAQGRRTATWNIGAAERSPAEAAQSASGLVERVGPVDILILQEVIDQVRAVAEATGLEHWVISDLAPPEAVTGSPFASLELAILSRAPIVSAAEWDTTGRRPEGDGFAPRASSEMIPTEEILVDVSFGPERPSRGFLRADLEGGISVYSAHWKSSRGQYCNAADLEFARQREDQAAGMALDAARVLEAGGSVILGGDFNIQAPGRAARVGTDPNDDCESTGSCDGARGEGAADGYDDSIQVLLEEVPGARLLSGQLPETFVAASFPGGAIDHLLVAGPAAAQFAEASTPDAQGGSLACCRFRGHEDKIVTKELESGHAETNVQSGVQDRGGEAGDGAGRIGPAGEPGP